jgi:hypothetical protein
MVFPNSLMGAVLPQMVSRGNDSDLSVKALDVLLLLTPLFLLGIMISPEFMRLWMGQTFADHATLSLQILGVAFWLEMVGSVMYFQILATGKPKKNFLIAAATAPPYLALLYIFTFHWGVAGTSFAYLIKNLLSLAGRTAVIGSTRRVLHRIWLDASVLAIMLGICWMPAPDFIRIAAGLILLAVCIIPKMNTLKLYLLPYANRIRRAQPSGF